MAWEGTVRVTVRLRLVARSAGAAIVGGHRTDVTGEHVDAYLVAWAQG